MRPEIRGTRYLPCGSGGSECSGETDNDHIFVGDAVCDVDFVGREVMVKFYGGKCVSYLHSQGL